MASIMVLIVFIISLCCGWHIEKGWNGFLPLKSNRTEIEQFLKQNEPDHTLEIVNDIGKTVRVRYKSTNSLLHFEYTKSECIVRTSLGTNQTVKANTVLSYDVVVKNLTTSDFKWNKSEFTREKDIHVAGFVHYRNLAEGVSIEARETETGGEDVRSVRYFPAKEQNGKLDCE